MKPLVITHMGSPETLEDIPEFLKKIFLDKDLMKLPVQGISGRLIAKLRAPEAKRHYIKAGGISPLAGITYSLAEKLKKRFRREKLDVDVRFTHSKPYLEDIKDEPLIIFPLYPQYSMALTGAVEKKMPQAEVLKSWHAEEEFIECMRRRIRDALKNSSKDETLLLFTAHSLPEYLIKQGDPYREQVEEMFQVLAGYFKGIEAKLAYTGRAGPKKWIGPEAKDVIRNTGKKNVVCTYLSLPVDNIEILYDMDVELKERAGRAGIENFIRVLMPNDDDDFADAVEKIIRRRIL